jgi:YHS domain-containing protein
MSRIKLFVVLLLVAFFVTGNVFGQETQKQEKKDEQVVKVSKEKPKDDGKPVNTICPVSTEPADGDIVVSHNGKTYAVCCKSCLKKFEKDPEKYINRLSEDGKSIKKK